MVRLWERVALKRGITSSKSTRERSEKNLSSKPAALIALGVCISPTLRVWVRLKAKSLLRVNLFACREWLTTTSIPLVSTSTALAKNCTVFTLAWSKICLSSFCAGLFPAGRVKASVRIIRSSIRIK